ncbi:MAG TPA: hypothetical protein VFD84_09975, partial [Candidatus Binatia bacterium]|nr:hypothetical protein [Candidatus Binatia bacterium]
MRRLLLLAFVATLASAAHGERRESAADVAAALAHLPARAAPQAAGPRRIYVVVPALTPGRRAALEAAGLAIELPAPGTPAPRWGDASVVVQGVATPAAERAIRALPFVHRIDTPGEQWSNVGAVTTAGDAAIHADAARAVLGTDGAGVTVGVVSVGLDHLAASVASGDLPSDVTMPAIPGVGAGHGDEGTAMLEIVHDVAPGARLLFASPDTSAEMVATIEAMA